jgi:hypothetical protein
MVGKVGQEGLGKKFFCMREFSDGDKRRYSVIKISNFYIV